MHSKVAWAFCGIGVLIVALLIFDAGVSIGVRRALGPRGIKDFGPGGPLSFGVGNFGVPLPHGFIPGGHGAVGVITTISLPQFSIKTRDGNTEQVTLESETTIRDRDQELQPADLQIGENVVVIGEPNEQATSSQEIEARLIRVLSLASVR